MLPIPKISIITITFNNISGLHTTVDSVISQNYSNIEYIVVDGASNDGTKEYLSAIKYDDLIWSSEPDLGIYNAMNKGITKATGDWVCFMNSGDCFYNNDVISEVFCRKLPNDIDIIYCDVILRYPRLGDILKTFKSFTGAELPLSLCHQSTFTKLDLLRKMNGFDESFKIAADINFFYNAFLLNNNFYYIPKPIAYFDVNGISSIPSFSKLKEFKRIQAGRLSLFRLIKEYFICMIKFTLYLLLPNHLYFMLEYRRITNKFK